MTDTNVPQIFDRARRAMRYERAALRVDRSSDAAGFLHADMAADVLERIDFMQLPGGTALVVGDLFGTLTSAMTERGFAVDNVHPGSFDDEAPLGWSNLDCIVSLAAIDTVNDLPGSLVHLRAALAPDGVLFAQLPGAGSLRALRTILLAADADTPAARLHPQIDTRSAAALLQRAGFARQVVDSRSLTVRYSGFERLIADLRDQALTGVLADRPPPLTRAALTRAHGAFDELREDDGKVTETIELLALTGWR